MDTNTVICHERLSIVGVNDGSQPLTIDDDNYILSINGEIYNYKELYETALQDRYETTTNSDCEVILYLYKEFGLQFLNIIRWYFFFVLYDKKKKTVLIA